MRWTRTFAALSFALFLPAASGQPIAQEAERYQPPFKSLPPTAERAYRAFSQRIDGPAAMDSVRFLDQYWRVAGNPGFNASIDHIRDRLKSIGYADSPVKGMPWVRVEEWGQPRGWDYQLGTVTFADDGE